MERLEDSAAGLVAASAGGDEVAGAKGVGDGEGVPSDEGLLVFWQPVTTKAAAARLRERWRTVITLNVCEGCTTEYTLREEIHGSSLMRMLVR